jgi:hypothetical protein
MTETAISAALELVNTPPAYAMTVCMAGIYLTLWKAQDKAVRLMLLHAFLIGFLGSLTWWALDTALTRAEGIYNCIGVL